MPYFSHGIANRALTWFVLIGFLLAVVLVSALLYREKSAWVWVPFVLFWVCLFQGVWAIGILEVFRSINYSGIA